MWWVSLFMNIKKFHIGNDDEYEESESEGGWINWFCELEGHDFFAEVIDCT